MSAVMVSPVTKYSMCLYGSEIFVPVGGITGRSGRTRSPVCVADFIVSFQQNGHAAPWTPQERWENQDGYSPATIASEIAGLVCAAEIAKANADAASAQRYLDHHPAKHISNPWAHLACPRR